MDFSSLGYKPIRTSRFSEELSQAPRSSGKAIAILIIMDTNNPHFEYFEKKLKSSRAFLTRWNGGWAEMWELTPSIKTLHLLIRREDKSGNLLISCGDPIMIRGPVRWMNCDLRVTTTTLPGGQDTGFLVADDLAGVEIICGDVGMRENVKLWVDA